jgi:hypothetical protein
MARVLSLCEGSIVNPPEHRLGRGARRRLRECSRGALMKVMNGNICLVTDFLGGCGAGD